MDHKHAFLNKEIDLADYLYAQAANIDYKDYVDDVVGENESLYTSGLDKIGSLDNTGSTNSNFSASNTASITCELENMSIVQPNYTNMVPVIQQFVSLVEDNSDPLNLFNFNASNNVSNNEIIKTNNCKVCGYQLKQNDHIKCSSCHLILHFSCNAEKETQ